MEVTAKEIQNIYDDNGYSLAIDANELVTDLEKKRDLHGWDVNVVKNGTGKLTHVFWMRVEQIVHARRFAHLILHDNTHQSNIYDLDVGLFVDTQCSWGNPLSYKGRKNPRL